MPHSWSLHFLPTCREHYDYATLDLFRFMGGWVSLNFNLCLSPLHAFASEECSLLPKDLLPLILSFVLHTIICLETSGYHLISKLTTVMIDKPRSSHKIHCFWLASPFDAGLVGSSSGKRSTRTSPENCCYKEALTRVVLVAAWCVYDMHRLGKIKRSRVNAWWKCTLLQDVPFILS